MIPTGYAIYTYTDAVPFRPVLVVSDYLQSAVSIPSFVFVAHTLPPVRTLRTLPDPLLQGPVLQASPTPPKPCLVAFEF
jgi:hypothetical protein